jgi:Domain of unknown function (DUF4332)/Zinc dependent phospholipase C
MALFYRLLTNSISRNAHQRLAVEALMLLKGEAAGTWRNLFLHHHKAYLKGAVAPDEVFKDFKNHVLHVREGDWGGAPMAAREWYRRAVRALKDKDWRHAVYCAGVMSHYVVDPLQPLHTGQTEEENVIHRAVEWSCWKSHAHLNAILERDLGGPPGVVSVPGDDWLEQMIRAGAREANQHYDTVVDHFDFAAAAKKPEAGLDQELKDRIAKQMGYTRVLLAHVLNRAFAEAAVAPPKASLGIATFKATATMPLRSVVKVLRDVRDYARIRAMHDEFRTTGKLRDTLNEDDKTVRALHATEVLKKPLSTLDALWPREIGTKHGTGTPARSTKKVKPPRAEKPKPQPKATPPATKGRQAPPPAKGSVKSARATAGRGQLDTDAPVEIALAIDAKSASRLAAIGVTTVKDLLSVSPDGAAAQIKFRHINAHVIRDWQAQAELACSVPGLDSMATQLLVAVSVRDADDLANADADMVVNMIEEFCESPDGRRVARDAEPPTRDQVEKWIAAAKGTAERRAA